MNIFSDYWATFPNHKIFSSFNKLTSEEMWVLFLLFNPTKANPLLSMLDRKDKEKEIIATLKIDKKRINELSKLEDEYSEKILVSRAKKELAFYYKQLEERRKYIESVPYNSGNAEHKDKMIKGTKAIWDEFEKIKLIVEKEESLESQTRGNRVESAAEKKLI
ncbi:MAG: hypothetical protein BWX56_01021 [Euryarchaeota archaeon ADurb.Bin023]|jgi:hypothetical protein|nr:hypothetical protein [Bacteroidia bacterium]NOJ29145.1 hypothetical protein [Nitrososphaeraceae archaeon]OQC51366.1 MAG: hypothetical protein BWX56_01021 [Euryarchaeota archaeon ADurb.Bin023]TXG80495.1 MAG: hypothetical protein E6R13_07940 [Spirochaetota bacterium]